MFNHHMFKARSMISSFYINLFKNIYKNSITKCYNHSCNLNQNVSKSIKNIIVREAIKCEPSDQLFCVKVIIKITIYY